jgi:type III restriction enzyme
MSSVFQIKPDIFYTGVVDKDLEIFDIIMETKYGTTYNSYLIKDEKVVLFDTVKDCFKDDNLYKYGLMFLNQREEKSRKDVFALPPHVRETLYTYKASSGISSIDSIMADNDSADNGSANMFTAHKTIKQIAELNYAIVHKALLKYPIFTFNSLKSYFPNLKSIREFICSEHYLGGIRIDIESRDKVPRPVTMFNAVFQVLGKIAISLSNIEKTYKGTKEFYSKKIREVFKNKLVNYTDPHDGGIGISQNDSSVSSKFKLDLSKEDWFAYTDNYGTSEEKAFVAYFSRYIADLKKKYSKIFLVRNERACCIYSFESGERFEPDYVLFLQKTEVDGFEQIQIFIEPKGTQLLEKDAWKENFLLELKDNAVPVKMFVDDNNYRIWGMHFFNQDNRMKVFDSEVSSLLD